MSASAAGGFAGFFGAVESPLSLALAELGLIDEYEIIVHPRITALFAGLSKPIDLKLISRLELESGTLALRCVPR